MSTFDKPVINIQPRINLALILVGAVFFFLIVRLGYLQLLQADFFRSQSENNRLRTVFVPAPRGMIYDRNGNVVAKNRPSFNVDLVSEDSPHPEETLRHLAKILGEDTEKIVNKISNQKKRRRFEPKLILKDVSRDVVARVTAHRHELPGIVINVNPARNYVYGEAAGHLLGYIREITKDQIEKSVYAGYMQGDVIGQYGIEAKWERFLQGKRGVQAVIVNARGNRIGESYFEPEVAGNNLYLTVDLRLQNAAFEALRGKKGAIVAMAVNSGEILAMLSEPAFDPNIFTSEVSTEQWRDLISGPEKRMNNRVAQGAYPPGSTFKIFTAIAAMAEGVISKNERIFCPGFLQFGSRTFRCHKSAGHGNVNLYDAIVQSCDVYFYTMGQRLGVDRIHDYSTRYGLGIETGLDLVEESPGLIPSTEWKKRYFRDAENQKWYPGETLSVAIGQGAVTVTPLQLARSIAAVINGGKVLRPYLIRKIESNDGRISDENFGPAVVGRIDIEPQIIEAVKQGMYGVVNDPQGTGQRSKLDINKTGREIKVAGKTGTAQVVSLGAGKGEHHEDHAWFFGYAPAEKPEILVVALVENGGHGGVAAAPPVKQVMEAYFNAH